VLASVWSTTCERLTHRDLRQHEDAAALGRHHQLMRGGLPLRLRLIGLAERGDIVACIAKRSEHAAAGKLDRIIEGLRPTHHGRFRPGLAGVGGGAGAGKGLNVCVSHWSMMTDCRSPLYVSLSKKIA
jgi:hypothetical protein